MTRPTSARLARYGFSLTDAGPKAADLLGGLGLWNTDGQEPADEGAGELLTVLSRTADPNLALRQLHRVVEAERRAHPPAETPPPPAESRLRRALHLHRHHEEPVDESLLGTLRRDKGLARRLFSVLGASSSLGDDLVADPDRWQVLRTEKNGVAPSAEGTLDLGADGPPTVPALRRAYRAALLRIAAADLTAGRGLEQTMAAITALADATLGAAYDIAVSEVPAEPSLSVIAMGKCGAVELNYVSDVDVIFVCRGDEDLAAGTTVAARLIEICGQVAWPVDAALRPEGGRGPLVRTLSSHLAYYHRWARTWEFQALLKARHAVGDAELGAEWLAQLGPLIWHAAERPEAVDDIRKMRRRIIDQVPPKQKDREIKRGPGGLRDIEFAVQLLQLVHGRVDESLRVGGTVPALRALVNGGYVGRQDGETLLRGYRFLRAVEHRLQLQHLSRTHTVPAGTDAQRWLAQSLGYAPLPGRDVVESFRADWVAHAAGVRRLHAKLLYRPLLESVARVPAEQLRMYPESARRRLQVLGYADPAGALRHIESLTGGLSRTAAIQRTLLPVLLEELADAPEPDRGLLSYRQLSDKLGSAPWYLRLLRDEGPVVRRLARLLGLSRYAADLLARDPEALRLLADDAELTPRTREVLEPGFMSAATRHLSADLTQAIAAVRALRRRELLRLACADVLANAEDLAPARPAAMQDVARGLSAVTDATLAAALRVAREAQDTRPGLRFTVIGMGRLGGDEMSYSSDADVLFVFDAPASDRAAGQSSDSQVAHAIAEELRRLLGMPAHDPPLGIDADLRPEGRQGPLVRSLAAYRSYYERWSKVWEAQALLRARYVCGDVSLGDEFLALADTLRYPDGGLSREHVTEIRRIKARVENERLPRGADPATHTKLGRGGLADVEWAVQLLQLRHAHAVPGLRSTRTLDALDAARDAGLVDDADTAALRAGWTLAAEVRNALTLVRGRPTDQLPRHGPELAGVVQMLGAQDPQEFVDEYLKTTRRARAATEHVLEG
ncbi:bifunctional [glutamine synthetase] adenylyltransferase/[glutamine synthetase]-adenylyl-L-tyrosine phosphorylase [Catenuloplanes japonicus]|uniref:bifunctional [glutamine synthetase] adenylyltransferase/[glutamine synthetase]-adenylyl-L-tyrosine phosphorylase n=1 Tax=Catenuloplanes japonicus TaxID=33876 RepID=UPI00052795ED|nr:bifunctional [glutamine synthetase] adenylyltransferase/[glutamine synthetase]-adenylyl-L-tyrosine phosphorylase [Catenuloplanes japonicus]